MQLSQAAINQHQAGHGLLFLLHALVAAHHHLAHRSEIIYAIDCANDEFSVIRFLHLAIFPDHHRSHRLSALNVRDVETLDALWQFGKAKSLLQLFLNFSGVWFEHAESLVVGLLGVRAGKVDERTLVPALRHQNVDRCGAGAPARDLLGEQVLQLGAILEINRDIKIAGDIRLADVELLQKGREEFAGMKTRVVIDRLAIDRLVILRPAFLAGRRIYGVVGRYAGASRSGTAGRVHKSFGTQWRRLRMTG